jgi:hypothetical protein
MLVASMPFLVLAIPTAIIGNLLAREKERNVPLWTLLGAIPGVGWFSVAFFIGASNRRLERKLDAILNRLEV